MFISQWLYRLFSISYRAGRWYARRILPWIAPQQARVRMADGTVLLLEPRCDYVQREAFLYAGRYVYEKQLVEWMQGNIRPGMLVLDVGAHIGYFSGIISRRIGPGGRALFVEPFPDHFQMLEENLQLNGFENCLASNVALSDRTGSLSLYPSMDSGRNSLAQVKSSDMQPILVRSLSLDDLFAEYGLVIVDLMQIDIEGAECLVLNARQAALAEKRIRCILCEFHPRQMREDFGKEPLDFLGVLDGLGYSITRLDPTTGLESSFNPSRAGEYQHLVFRAEQHL